MLLAPDRPGDRPGEIFRCRRIGLIADCLPDCDRIRMQVHPAQARVGPEAKVRPGFRRHGRDFFELHRVLVRRIEGQAQRPFEAGEFAELGMVGVARRCIQEFRHPATEPAHIAKRGGMRGNILACQGVEGLVAQVGMQDVIVVAEDFDQAKAVGVAVDCQARVAEFGAVAVDFSIDGGIPRQHVVLEMRFGCGQWFHALFKLLWPVANARRFRAHGRVPPPGRPEAECGRRARSWSPRCRSGAPLWRTGPRPHR